MSHLLSLTLYKKNGEPATGAIAFDIDDIVSPIRVNTGGKSYFVAKMMKGTPSGQGDGSNGRVDYEVNEDLAAIIAQSKKLVNLTVIARRGVDVNSEPHVFNISRISESIRPLFDTLGGETSTFFYCESGDPQPVEYEVSQRVSQIVAAQLPALTAWSPGGNSFGAEQELGTNDNFDVPVITNGVEVARFTTGGDFAIGLTTALARVHAKGATSDNTTYALILEDSSGNAIFSARNDRAVYVKDTGGFAADVSFGVAGFTETEGWRSTGYQKIKHGVNDYTSGDARANIEWDTSSASSRFITGIKNDDIWGIFCANASDYGFEIDRTTRNIGLSVSPASDIKLKVRGASATSSDYTARFETSTGVNLFSVRNDGRVSAPLIQTGNAGLVTGDLYVDTAANILANGDVVVGRKV